jgi:steroid 5-alpha reductase family enzyme
MLNLFITSLTVVLVYKILVFFISLSLKRNDIADISWGISFILVAIVSLLRSKGENLTLFLLSTLVLIWGARLAARVALRNHGKNEDSRYQKLRKDFGKFFLVRSFLQVYILQGILAVLVAFPILVASENPSNLGWLSLFGLVIWLFGFFFEVVGDFQLDQFISKSENKGKVLKTGLWKYSRHPNYFGEITMWWGILLITLQSENSLLAMIGPLLITFLIIYVSGIPMLEKKYTGNTEYEDYKKTTSVLLPLPRK